ncbi:hypothetical protein A5630_23060 [Mycolicibacterium mucogenicum]|uniref:Uncharacterized protein n=1 Tax=Mycolicibacterium mucogenicum TaxID=56689 RepID=A0A1A3GZW1_MYCMU|nr:hypothetical protein A5630_23060 [Mycolicibacterium mucogenicum]
MFSEDHPISPRYVLALIKYLPLESAYVAELRGGQRFRGWGHDRFQMVHLINQMKVLTFLFILANRDPKKSAPKPQPMYPMPEDKPETKPAPKPGSFAFIAHSLLDEQRQAQRGA